jgi:hypothetical protein
LPHSEIYGSKGARPSPQLIAACHVLHRLLPPRHPSNALESLDRSSFLIAFMHGEDCAAITRITTHTATPSRKNALDNVKVHPASRTTALARTDEPSIHDVIEPPARAFARRRTCFLQRAPILRIGGARRDRTDDLKLAKLPLSQLSYGPDQFPFSVISGLPSRSSGGAKAGRPGQI